MCSLLKFASVHTNVHNHFNFERHLVDKITFKTRRDCTRRVAVAVQLSPHVNDTGAPIAGKCAFV